MSRRRAARKNHRPSEGCQHLRILESGEVTGDESALGISEELIGPLSDEDAAPNDVSDVEVAQARLMEEVQRPRVLDRDDERETVLSDATKERSRAWPASAGEGNRHVEEASLETDELDGDGEADEPSSDLGSLSLLQRLDRRQNEVLAELDRLNARIDGLISELHQQREEQAA